MSDSLLWDRSGGAGIVVCNVLEISPNASAIFTITVTAGDYGTIENVVLPLFRHTWQP